MKTCPQCGAELQGESPAGLCPRCLIHGAFDSAPGEEDGGNREIESAANAGEEDFGRYRILRPVGEGGMGTVYLAEQREPIRRLVALKVVKLGMDTNQVLARFANERQTLALMEHPHIARIFDAGATPKGRPYFVMEYIVGDPITQYCDGHRMTIAARLKLFLAVCRAVQHAHEKGVIHRDLKPSNVLVTEQDGEPVPKVIDFGIAKATDQWAVENTMLTELGQMVGTPEYASPEQAEVVSGEVDQSADVYSLGVLFYELLAGRVPFEPSRLRRAGLAEMLRIIREEEAPPLARRLAGTDPSEIAGRRGTDAASLGALLRGDLERIARKALEKQRQRRYVSVRDMAADIERYLDRRPVAAGAGYAYRTGKFARRHWLAVAAAALLVAMAGGWALRSLEHRAPPAGPVSAKKRTVVLGDFENHTGDQTFDSTLRPLTAAELAKSPEFRLLPDKAMAETLRLMLRSPDTKVTADLAAEICERTGSAAVVDGSVASLGTQYVLGLRARNCRSGDILFEEHASAGRKEDVVRMLSEITGRFRNIAGARLPAAGSEASLPANVTTPSLDAWRSYSAAMKMHLQNGLATEVIPLLQRAVELDPQFAMAYAYLGRQYASFGESEISARYMAKAYELRQRTSSGESYFITFNYQRQVPRNLELARETLESWARESPRDIQPRGFLAAFTTQGSGHFEKAVEEGMRSIALDPDYVLGYVNVVFAQIYANHLSDARELLRKAAQRGIDNPTLSICRYFIAFLENDPAAMEQEAARRQAKMEGQGFFEQQEALTLAYQGRLKEAARQSGRAVLLAKQAGLKERAALFAGARAVWSALYGLREEATQNAAAALGLYRSRDADYGPALASDFMREPAQGHRIASSLEKRYPEDTSVQFSYLPVLRAMEAMDHSHPEAALEATQAGASYDLAVPGTAFYTGAFFGAMYAVYARGLAYAGLGQHREAAAEFQKIADHPTITLNDPIGPLARLQLARQLAAAGDRAGSAAAYRAVLDIWKQADSGIPVAEKAKRESLR